jgi:hypothetical protein
MSYHRGNAEGTERNTEKRATEIASVLSATSPRFPHVSLAIDWNSMLFRLLIELILNSIFGNPDEVQRDRTPWPTWLVFVLLACLIAGVVLAYLAIAGKL